MLNSMSRGLTCRLARRVFELTFTVMYNVRRAESRIYSTECYAIRWIGSVMLMGGEKSVKGRAGFEL